MQIAADKGAYLRLFAFFKSNWNVSFPEVNCFANSFFFFKKRSQFLFIKLFKIAATDLQRHIPNNKTGRKQNIPETS